MLNPDDQKKLRKMIRTNWYVFISYAGAVIMYTVVVYVVVGTGSSEPHQVGILKPLFIAVSIVLAAAKFLIQSRLWLNEDGYGGCRSLDEIMARYGRYYYIVLALCSAVPLLGLIITFLTMQMADWWPFFGIAVVLFATSAPRAEKIESIVQAQATRVGSKNF
jgi:hypothetical protein